MPVAALALAAVLALPVRADDPSKRPEGVAHPPSHGSSRPTRRDEVVGQTDRLLTELARVVSGYVREQAEEDGAYIVEEEGGKAWGAKFLGPAPHTLRKLPGGRVRACMLFRGEPEGEEGRDAVSLDVDFTLVRENDAWVVEEDALHKVGSRELFRYDAKGRRVRARASPAPPP